MRTDKQPLRQNPSFEQKSSRPRAPRDWPGSRREASAGEWALWAITLPAGGKGAQLARGGKKVYVALRKGQALRRASSGVLEVVDDAADLSARAKTVSNLHNNVNRKMIVDALRGKTEMATQVADAIASGRVKVNLLGDEMFDTMHHFKAWQARVGGTMQDWISKGKPVLVNGNVSSTLGFAIDGQIYLRRAQGNALFGQAVHEGVHGIQHNSGMTAVLGRDALEAQAYSAQRAFNVAAGLDARFSTMEDMFGHIYNATRP